VRGFDRWAAHRRASLRPKIHARRLVAIHVANLLNPQRSDWIGLVHRAVRAFLVNRDASMGVC
jgi:hypothetical protein